jgi:ribosomal protein S18 acetylase RimI-like enzyme
MTKIRNFRPLDADKVCSFKRESARVNFPGCEFNAGLFRKLLLRGAKRHPECIKIAEENGRVVGYIWFKTIESAVGVFGRVEHIFVDEAYRGKGLGRKLMESAEDYFRKHGLGKMKLTVSKDNETAVALYRDMGYETKRFKMEKDL